jgi:hypothetical protein
MKKLFLIGMLISFSAIAQTAPPSNWGIVSKTDVYYEPQAQVYKGATSGEVYRAEIWIWTKTQGYLKLIIGCSYDSYRILQDGKEFVNRNYDPGHPFWVLKTFCY